MQQRNWFTSETFETEYGYDQPLGAFCGEDGTRICLWAPTAQAVFLHLYTAGNYCPAEETVAMEKGIKGVWYYRTRRNLDGWYYDFDVTVEGITRRTADPYARACGVNGNRSMVIDLSRTDPQGWQQDQPPAKTPEQVIWEIHVKDFSWDAAGGFPEEERGKYAALCRVGTTWKNRGDFSTGLDYLKRLGVTHVQLMPVYDYGSVDEEKPEDYNWGYDPVNYNVPEGSYASDPYHGEVRIRELKQAVLGLHKAGFRVIMDVVYNHSYAADSWLERTVPGYYYRRDRAGRLSNGSGCGNDLATERTMCARYIRQSVLYWAREYHMDGFRFDLMGLLDRELMESIRRDLDAEFGPGEKLIYGEPWRAGDTALSRQVDLCDKGSIKTLPVTLGAFCDETRDAVKGSLMHAHSRGFVSGGGLHLQTLCSCLKGWAGDIGPFTTPQQTVNYLSCHDDWTLWDKLVCALEDKQIFTGFQPEILRANRMAAAILFCCQGRPFFLAGEEFGRTKGGIKNSYRSPASVNMLDWTRAKENRDLTDYYRGWIALRNQLPALLDKTDRAGERLLWSRQLGDDCAAVCLDNTGGSWEKLLLIFNCGRKAWSGPLPEGGWQVLADGESSFRWQELRLLEGEAALPAISVLVLGRK